jgi:serine/threonine protein kinase
MATAQDVRELLVCPRCLAVFRTGFRACPRDGEQLKPTAADPLIDTILGERYQIEALLGEGGIGRVYRARHTRMSRRYAIKVPYGEVAYDPKVRARFANEAEAASRLSHPNVIAVVDFGETAAGLLYMVMDYAEGRPLASLIDEIGPLDRAWVLRFSREIAEGLAHAHDRGLVHRDLKPDNIIIERDGDRPRIVDFGLAIFREDTAGRMTTEGTVLGTPHYMAPEQATGQEIDPRTDLFALGLVIYEMLCGVLPFDGTPVQVARKNLSMPVPMIGERVPGLEVDPAIESVCHHLLAKRPDDRPATAHAVVEMLRRIEKGDTNTWRIDAIKMPAPRPVTDAAPAAVIKPAPETPAPEPAPAAELRVEGGRSPIHTSPNAPLMPPPSQPTSIDVHTRPTTGNAVVTPIAADPTVPTALRPLDTFTDNLDQLAVDERRRRIRILGALAVAVLVLIVVVWRLTRAPGAAGAGDVPDAVPVIAIGPPADAATATVLGPTPDAAPLAVAVAPIDAAPAPVRVDARGSQTVRKPDARVAITPSRPDARVVDTPPPPKPDARVETPPPPKPDAAPVPPPPTQASLQRMYATLEPKITALEKAKGADAGKAIRKAWEDLPIGDAANPAMRADLLARIRALEGRIATAMKK